MGAGIATFISYFVLFLIRAVDTQKYLKIQWNIKKTLVSVVILFVQALIMTAGGFRFWFVLVPALFVLLAAINARKFCCPSTSCCAAAEPAAKVFLALHVNWCYNYQ